MTRTYHNTDERLPRIALYALLTVLMLFARCSQCRGQVHFQFNTSTVVMVDTAGQMDVGSASWPIIASGDSLRIESPAKPMLWNKIIWQTTDTGEMYCITPYFQAHYSPGPGGKSLMIRKRGRIRSMEFYEKQTTKL